MEKHFYKSLSENRIFATRQGLGRKYAILRKVATLWKTTSCKNITIFVIFARLLYGVKASSLRRNHHTSAA